MNIPEALTSPQRATLWAAMVLASEAATVTGEVPGGTRAIADRRGTTVRMVQLDCVELEALGLVRRRGHTSSAQVFVVELAKLASQGGQGSGGTRTSGGSIDDPRFRKWRAELGGVKRALKEVTGQRDAAKAEADSLRKGRRLNADPALVALLVDLDHAVDCAAPSCGRCYKIGRKVEAARADYATEAEIVDRIERAEALVVAGTELVDAQMDRSVGAQARRAAAFRAFALVVRANAELPERP